jgi:LuxR family transcriptional regulator, maltose regulon positive regulatory protein
LEVTVVGPWLDSKLHLPKRRHGWVARPRLVERLSGGVQVALTLVSAPPGFGKTALLADWLAIPTPEERAVAWLSLDHRDNDPTIFWTYLVAALKTAMPGIGADAQSILQSTQPPAEAVLSSLLNDLNAVSHDVVLVVDDYHVIDTLQVHDGMAFLLEHLPQQVHLVIAARADPPLPLARLRSRGEMVEIRAVDLRFTPDEAAAYLNEAMGLVLTAENVADLEGRTEGWIAALQLAALSMQGRDDVTAFITDFAGDDRYVVDYLAEEVMNRQPEDVRGFLTQTSILERLSGPLCDAVTGRVDGKATLARLERGNLFLTPLDDRRQWYRYHQLFADVLHSYLLDGQPDSVADLHGRASRWFERAGEPADAIRHALAAEDFDRAADLAELAIPVMARTRRESAVLGWLTALPDAVVRVRPVLIMGFVGALLLAGRPDGLAARLREAEKLLGEAKVVPAAAAGPSTKVVVADEAQFRALPGMIELYWAALALLSGDVPGTVERAKRAQDLSAADDHLCRTSAAGLTGLALWSSGNLNGGHGAYAECMAGLYRAGYIADTFGCAVALADIRITQGRLGDALRTYEQALQRGSQPSGLALRGTADMYVGMSEVACERDDLSAATAFLLRSQELGEDTGLPQNPYRWRVAMARMLHAQGDLAGALDLLDEAERVYNGDFFPNVRPVRALRARVLVAQGAVDEALAWAGERSLSPDDHLSYLREFEHITLARVLLARYDRDRSQTTIEQVTGLLGRLLHAAAAGERTGNAIEILVLQARAHQLREDIPAALASLDQALRLAEPEGYVRVFVNEGPAIASLLGTAAKKGTNPGYARRLRVAATDGHPTDTTVPTKQGLITPLSDRERDVLRLLATDLDGPGIARRLIVSLNTVRTHTKSIYTKLGVNNRRSAVRRAQELHLL